MVSFVGRWTSETVLSLYELLECGQDSTASHHILWLADVRSDEILIAEPTDRVMYRRTLCGMTEFRDVMDKMTVRSPLKKDDLCQGPREFNLFLLA